MAKELKLVIPAQYDKRLPSFFEAFARVRSADGWAAVKLFVTNNVGGLTIDPDYTVTNPDVKPIASEAFKIAVGKSWGKDGG